MDQLEPSNVVATFLQKQIDIELPMQALEVGKSFSLPKQTYSFVSLENFAEANSRNRKCFVVVEWDEVLELSRLPDGTSRQLFYRESFSKAEIDLNGSQLNKCLEIIKQYKAYSLAEVAKYGCGNAEMKSANVIPIAYLQRRLASISCYKNSPEGATAVLHKVIDSFIQSGVLSIVPSEVAKGTFETSGKLYQIANIA